MCIKAVVNAGVGWKGTTTGKHRSAKHGGKSETSIQYVERSLVVKRGQVNEGLLLSLAESRKRWGVVRVSYRQPRLCPTDIAGEA